MAIIKDNLFQVEKGTESWIRVAFVDSTCTPITGLTGSDLVQACRWKASGSAGVTDMSPAAGDLVEKSAAKAPGEYDFKLEAADTNFDGELHFYLEETSGASFRGMILCTTESNADKLETLSTDVGDLDTDISDLTSDVADNLTEIQSVGLAVATNLTAIQAIGNSTYESLSVAFSYVRPLSGSVSYIIPLAVRDRDTSGMVDTDSLPVIRIYVNGGTVLVNTTMSKEDTPRTGIYKYEWTIASTDSLYSDLIVDVTYAVDSVTSVVVRQTSVVDPLVEDVIQAGCEAAIDSRDVVIASDLTSITNSLSSIGGDITTIDGVVDNIYNDLATVDGKIDTLQSDIETIDETTLAIQTSISVVDAVVDGNAQGIELTNKILQADRKITNYQEQFFIHGEDEPFLSFNLYTENGVTRTMVYPYYRIQED